VVSEQSNKAPGTVLSIDNKGLLIATGQGQLIIRDIQAQGKKRMAVADFCRGYSLQAGEVLR